MFKVGLLPIRLLYPQSNIVSPSALPASSITARQHDIKPTRAALEASIRSSPKPLTEIEGLTFTSRPHTEPSSSEEEEPRCAGSRCGQCIRRRHYGLAM